MMRQRLAGAACALLLLRHGAEAKSSASSSTNVDPTTEMASKFVYQVTILLSADRPPFSYFDPEQGVSGFDVDLVSAVCEEAGLDCPLVLAPHTEAWASSPKGYMGAGIRRGEFDCATSCGSKAARLTGMAFSFPYTKPEAGVLLARNTSAWTGVDGKTVGVVLGSSCDAHVAGKLLPGASMVVSFEDGQKLVENLEASTIDAALVCDDTHAHRLTENSSSGVVGRFADVSEGLSYMCHPRKELQARLLNLGLRAVRVKDSGLFLQRLCVQWNVSCEYTGLGSNPIGVEQSAPSWSRPGSLATTRLLALALVALVLQHH